MRNKYMRIRNRRKIKRNLVLLFVVLSLVSMILNIILLSLLKDKKDEPEEECELPIEIAANPDLEIVDEYEFAQEGLRA